MVTKSEKIIGMTKESIEHAVDAWERRIKEAEAIRREIDKKEEKGNDS